MPRKLKSSALRSDAVTVANIPDGEITAIKLSSTAISDKLGYTPASASTVASQLATLVDSAPTTLDTLNELAAALGDDPNFATTVTTTLGTKANSSDVTSALALKADASSVTNASNLTSGTLSSTRLPSGVVLQVQQSVITSAFTMGTSDWTDISGFACNITPLSVSSKIVVYIFTGSITAGGNAIDYRIVRNGSPIGIGDASSNRDRVTTRTMREGDTNHVRAMPTVIYVDTPGTTNAITYKIQVKNEGNGTIFFNRAQTDTDTSNAYGGRSISTIVLMEIA